MVWERLVVDWATPLSRLVKCQLLCLGKGVNGEKERGGER